MSAPPLAPDGPRTPAQPIPHDIHTVRPQPFILPSASLSLSAFALCEALVNLVPLMTGRGTTPHWLHEPSLSAGRDRSWAASGYGTLTRRTTPRARTAGVLFAEGITTALLGCIPGPVSLLLAAAVIAGTARGIATLLQATAITDRWGPASYGTLSSVIAAPVTVATAIAPWAGATLAAPLGGVPLLFIALAVVSA